VPPGSNQLTLRSVEARIVTGLLDYQLKIVVQQAYQAVSNAPWIRV
jgi:hypothetical protein